MNIAINMAQNVYIYIYIYIVIFIVVVHLAVLALDMLMGIAVFAIGWIYLGPLNCVNVQSVFSQ